jgi:hypothetical protein
MLSTTRRIAATCMLAGFTIVSACGDSNDSSSTDSASEESTESSLAPEDIKVDAATVVAGFTQMPATIAAAIAAIGTPDAEAKLDAVEELWASFEGTVRDTDSALYLQIEDQLTPLQRQITDGDAEAATATAGTMAELFAQYLELHPA